MKSLERWMRIVGVYYVLQFVAMAIIKAPIRAEGPAGTLAQAAAGNPLAKFVVDTWFTFSLEVAAIGVALLVASRMADRSRTLVWTVIAIEVSRGLIADSNQIVRGNHLSVAIPWIVIHSAVIATGLLVLKGSRSIGEAEPALDTSPPVRQSRRPASRTQ